MAALSGLIPSFSHKFRSVHGGVATAFGSSSLVRLHGGTISRRRSSLTTSQRRDGASFVSPRCRAGLDEALLSAIFPSTTIPAYDFTRERCNIVVIGLSGPCIPVETREKLAIVESEWPRSIEELCKLDDIEEAAVLSTCSRLEIYVLALRGGSGVSQVTDWISKSSGVPVSEIRKHGVVLYDKDAVEHLFKVSSGLDSLGLDESQILEQVEQVFVGALGFGRMMRRLFLDATIVGNRVRNETSIAAAGAGAVCVSSAAVELALMKLSESCSLDIARILVVGAGKMGELVIKHLVARGCKKMVVVNRSRLRVEFLRMDLMKEEEGVEIIYKPVSEMYECAAAADVVFTATTSEKPLFLKQHVEKLPPAQQQRLFVDLSVPRNVGSCVASLGTAIVFKAADLKLHVVYGDAAELKHHNVYDDDDDDDVAAAAANNEDRLMKARSIIDEETNRFEVLRGVSARGIVKRFRESLEEIRIAWLEKRLSEFGGDITEEQRKSIEDYSWERINKGLKKWHDRIARVIQEEESKLRERFSIPL